ncbi:Chaperone protein TorD [bacterium HR23]|nr:Chaperone protein TorD [bacterium HR23]
MPVPFADTSLGRLAQGRQGVYRLLASLFFYPEGERLTTLAAVARALDRMPLAGFTLFPVWRRLVDTLSALAPARLPDLQGEYAALFLRSTQEGALPPREGVSHGLSGPALGELLGRLQEVYREAGLTLSEAGYPADHIAVELEFMAFLCGKEGQAWQGQDLGAGLAVLSRERTFLDEHLAVWLPPYARALAQQGASAWYGGVGEATAAWVLHDQGLVHALHRHLRERTSRTAKQR